MKVRIICTLTAAVLLSTACSANTASKTSETTASAVIDKSDYKLTRIESDMLLYEDLDSLEKDSDCIIIGEISDVSQDIEREYSGQFDKNIVTNVCTAGKIKVIKAIKGELEENQEITLMQRYAYVDETKQLISFSNATPMVKGDKWIFFMSKGYEDEFWLTGDYTARYPLPEIFDDSMLINMKKDNFSDASLLDKIPSEKIGVYQKECFDVSLYSEILKKYNIG